MVSSTFVMTAQPPVSEISFPCTEPLPLCLLQWQHNLLCVLRVAQRKALGIDFLRWGKLIANSFLNRFLDAVRLLLLYICTPYSWPISLCPPPISFFLCSSISHSKLPNHFFNSLGKIKSNKGHIYVQNASYYLSNP